jgi:hypothetical protein
MKSNTALQHYFKEFRFMLNSSKQTKLCIKKDRCPSFDSYSMDLEPLPWFVEGCVMVISLLIVRKGRSDMRRHEFKHAMIVCSLLNICAAHYAGDVPLLSTVPEAEIHANRLPVTDIIQYTNF